MTLRVVGYSLRGFSVLACLSLIGCQAGAHRQRVLDRSLNDQPTKTIEFPSLEITPDTVETLVIEDQSGRWLYALQYKNSPTDGSVEGTFDQKRNKIIIDTRDVERFRIDMTKLPINWNRLVIIRLNGKSSELRRRDSDVIDFEIDDHGNWVVDER